MVRYIRIIIRRCIRVFPFEKQTCFLVNSARAGIGLAGEVTEANNRG